MEENTREELGLECNKAAYYVQDLSDFTRDKYKITFDKDYQVSLKDGVIIAESKTIKLPKTFEDCCKVLGISRNVGLIYDLDGGSSNEIYKDHIELLRSFRKLMICRDAYRKIARWKPWSNEYNGNRIMFGIIPSGSTVRFNSFTCQGCMLMFPTEDMCKVFYENFKDLIFKCHDII